MQREVVWSNQALEDYLALLRHIARDNPNAAVRVADRVAATGTSLGEFAIGRPGRVDGTYEKVVTGLPYILAYEIIGRPDGGETVAILHVIHGARHWPDGSWPT